jgi:hypothetical protein
VLVTHRGPPIDTRVKLDCSTTLYQFGYPLLKLGTYVSMRIIYLAAAVGMAIAVLPIAPVVLMGASSAHADTNGYVSCTGSNGGTPDSVRVIKTELNSAYSPAQAAQILTAMGVNPNDAAAQVQCVLANWP